MHFIKIAKRIQTYPIITLQRDLIRSILINEHALNMGNYQGLPVDIIMLLLPINDGAKRAFGHDHNRKHRLSSFQFQGASVHLQHQDRGKTNFEDFTLLVRLQRKPKNIGIGYTFGTDREHSDYLLDDKEGKIGPCAFRVTYEQVSKCFSSPSFTLFVEIQETFMTLAHSALSVTGKIGC